MDEAAYDNINCMVSSASASLMMSMLCCYDEQGEIDCKYSPECISIIAHYNQYKKHIAKRKIIFIMNTPHLPHMTAPRMTAIKAL